MVIEVKFPFFSNHLIPFTHLVIGHFNLIHKGHYKLFAHLDDFAFFVFKNNPNKPFLYPLQQRLLNLAVFGPKYIFVYDIFQNNITPLGFILAVLQKLPFQIIRCGADFRFGTNQLGDVSLLQRFFLVETVAKNPNYSTRLIIKLLTNKRILAANALSVHAFFFEGQVILGQQMGSKYLVPTANIKNTTTIQFSQGSYACMVQAQAKWYLGICFVGIKKSFEAFQSLVETYLFDFKANLYGQYIRIYPLYFLRSNQKFNSIKALKRAIMNDCLQAMLFFQDFKAHRLQK